MRKEKTKQQRLNRMQAVDAHQKAVTNLIRYKEENPSASEQIKAKIKFHKRVISQTVVNLPEGRSALKTREVIND